MNNHEPLVLVPGLMCDATVWQHQVATLHRDRAVHIADHGLCDSLLTMAQRILDWAPPKFALAGHSMGGRVALEVVAIAPQRVTRLALLDTGYQALADGDAGARERAGRHRLVDLARHEGMLAMGKDWSRGMVHPSRLTDTALMNSIHSMIARATVEQFGAQIRALLTRTDRTALLATITLPTLVLCGHEDSWSPMARHEEMARLIAHSQLISVPDCGHMSTIEKPEAVSQALRHWLA